MNVNLQFAGEKKRVKIRDGADVEGMLKQLGISRETVIVSVNGVIVPDQTSLKGNDSVEVLKVVSGG